MDYNEAIEYINSISKYGMNYGLKRMSKLLEFMGNPEKDLKCIHIAGTNGKGSIASIVSSILMESGFKVGIFTSPHIERFSERIKINEQEIPNADILRLMEYIKPLLSRVIDEGFDHPNQIEIITAIMFKYFSEKKVDYAVIEVGLGGRFDATNVIDPLVSVIATISYDHMAVLGDTLSKIAYEKAGIIKENGIAVVYPQQKEAYEVIKKVCNEKKALQIDVGTDGIKLKRYSIDGQTFDMKVGNDIYEDINIKLLGEYQLFNCKTAVTAIKALSIKGINIDSKCIYEGLRNVRWPGRLEVMNRNPVILLDGAHNIEGIGSLKAALQKYFRYDRLVLVIGILKDKLVREMCDIIMPMADTIITVRPESNNAMEAEELGVFASKYCGNVIVSNSIDEAFKNGMNTACKDDLLLFSGSLYMIGHVRTIIKDMQR